MLRAWQEQSRTRGESVPDKWTQKKRGCFYTGTGKEACTQQLVIRP